MASINVLYGCLLSNFKKSRGVYESIALTLREIYLNDIIFVTATEQWMVYKCKRWHILNQCSIKRKFGKLESIADELIERVVDLDDDTMDSSGKKLFIKTFLQIKKTLLSKNYDFIEVERRCREFFKV